ncbi:MAG: hypothetical protein ACI4R6_08625 [Lachnospiraceae bacterium]
MSENVIMEKETYLAHVIGQTEYEAKYDNAAKKLLANKIVLAHILKGCVKEYHDCTIQDIAEKYIEGEPEIDVSGVHMDDTNHSRKADAPIEGADTVDTSLTEGMTYYDVRFNAIAPRNGDSNDGFIRLVLNVEAQNRFRLKYPLIKRAIYYCGRMISAQHGPVFTHSEYQKLRKVYSIWVCTNPPKEFRNTITRYSIQPETLVGNAIECTGNYDLINAVMICLGKPGKKDYAGLLKFLGVLFGNEMSADAKKKIFEEEFDIPMTESFESEVCDMCNLSQGILENGSAFRLIEMTVKKIKKGYSVPETADMLEESQDNIRRIYDIAAAMAPDYDVRKICEEYQDNSL